MQGPKIDSSKREITRHGSYDFPLAIYHTALNCIPLGFMPWHWHGEIQFCTVINGTISFYVNDKQFLCHKGDGIFINSGQIHMAKPEGASDSSYLCVDFDEKLISSFPGSIFETRYVKPYLGNAAMDALMLGASIDWQRKILEKIQQVDILYRVRGFGFEYNVAALLCQSWLQILEHLPRTSKQRPFHSTVIRGIVSYVGKHYSERVTIDKIAREMSFSSSECCRIFKKSTGQTIFSYLQLCRINRAGELLQQTELAVNQIAAEKSALTAPVTLLPSSDKS